MQSKDLSASPPEEHPQRTAAVANRQQLHRSSAPFLPFPLSVCVTLPVGALKAHQSCKLPQSSPPGLAPVSAACTLESHPWASSNTLTVLANPFSNVILITLVENVHLIPLVYQGLYLQTNPLLGCTAWSQQLIVSSAAACKPGFVV